MQTAKAQARLRIRAVSPEPLHIYSKEIDEGLDQELDILLHYMAEHAHLKNDFTEDENHYLVLQLICSFLTCAALL